MNPQDFDIVIIAFSGGKDSLACLLHLLDLGVSRNKIELWHHDVDGKSETFFDWPCTEAYCRAIASHFKIPIYFSWKDGGFKNELLRENEYSRKTFFETPEGLKTSGGDRGQIYQSCLEHPEWVIETKDKDWDYPVTTYPWELPNGAFGDNTGPT